MIDRCICAGLHTASIPGLTCLSLHPTFHNLVLTGGMDKQAVLFDTQSQKQVAAFKGHTKKITDVILHPSKDVCVTARYAVGTAKRRCKR